MSACFALIKVSRCLVESQRWLTLRFRFPFSHFPPSRTRSVPPHNLTSLYSSLLPSSSHPLSLDLSPSSPLSIWTIASTHRQHCILSFQTLVSSPLCSRWHFLKACLAKHWSTHILGTTRFAPHPSDAEQLSQDLLLGIDHRQRDLHKLISGHCDLHKGGSQTPYRHSVLLGSSRPVPRGFL